MWLLLWPVISTNMHKVCYHCPMSQFSYLKWEKGKKNVRKNFKFVVEVCDVIEKVNKIKKNCDKLHSIPSISHISHRKKGHKLFFRIMVNNYITLYLLLNLIYLNLLLCFLLIYLIFIFPLTLLCMNISWLCGNHNTHFYVCMCFIWIKWFIHSLKNWINKFNKWIINEGFLE